MPVKFCCNSRYHNGLEYKTRCKACRGCKKVKMGTCFQRMIEADSSPLLPSVLIPPFAPIVLTQQQDNLQSHAALVLLYKSTGFGMPMDRIQLLPSRHNQPLFTDHFMRTTHHKDNIRGLATYKQRRWFNLRRTTFLLWPRRYSKPWSTSTRQKYDNQPSLSSQILLTWRLMSRVICVLMPLSPHTSNQSCANRLLGPYRTKWYMSII